MKGRKAAIGVVLALAASAALIVSSVGSAKPKQDDFTMAIFTDIGTLQDRSFNQLANEGRIAIGKELGIPTRVYQTKKEAERIPNALAASRAGYNLIFGVGFLNYTAVDAVAPRYPDPCTPVSTSRTRSTRRSRRTRRASSSPSTRPATSSATSRRSS